METSTNNNNAISESEMQKLRIEVAKIMLPTHYTFRREFCISRAKDGNPTYFQTLMQDAVKTAFEMADEFVKQAKGGEQ